MRGGRASWAKGRLPAGIAGLCVVLLAGCVSSPTPPDHFYRLLPPAAEPLGPAPRLEGILSVEPLAADGLLAERSILHSEGPGSLKLQQYHYHFWSDAPSRMIQLQLASYLRGANLASVVTTPRMRLQPDYVVSGRIRRLERVQGPGRPVAVVELELTLRNADKEALVWGDTYRSQLEAEGDGFDATVAAFNGALAEIFARFVRDAARS